jgi:tripartite-type tricarboxylate transporter receptor subunit TctC
MNTRQSFELVYFADRRSHSNFQIAMGRTMSLGRLCKLTGRVAVVILMAYFGNIAAATESVADWPSRPIKILVGYPAGGSVDSAARVLAMALAAKVGQPVIVDNRVGADGAIAINSVVRGAADGYTLAVSLKGAMTVAPAVSVLPYDPMTDLVAIAPISQTAEIFVSRPKLGISNLSGLPEAYKTNGGKLSIGYVGAFPRLLSELLAHETKVDLLRVPYKGLPAAMQDLMGDQTDMIVGDAIGVLVEQIHSGKLIPLAVTSAKRQPNLPNVPTTAELGMAALTGNQWYALFGPKNLPLDLVAKISATVNSVMKQPSVVDQVSKYGMQPFIGTSADLTSVMKTETQFWKGVATKANIKPE